MQSLLRLTTAMRLLIDGKSVTGLIDAGEGVISEVEKGTHTVKVVAYGNGLMSKGITKTIEVDDGSLVDYISTVRNLTKGNATVTVEDINDGTEGSKDTKILVDGTISTENDKTVQTTYGKKEATVTLELTAPVDKSLVEELLIAFKANNTNATAFKIIL